MSSIETSQTQPINEYAIIVDPKDNVAVVKTETHPALEVVLPDKHLLQLSSAVPPGHRFATCDIPEGQFVLQFGQPIGTSLGIKEGEQITHENMSNEVPIVRDLPESLHTPAPDYIRESERATFMGYRRPDGRVGTRNYVLIVPTSMCASHEAQQISTIAEYTLYNRQKYPNVDGVVAIPHNKGCGCQDGSTIDVMLQARKVVR